MKFGIENMNRIVPLNIIAGLFFLLQGCSSIMTNTEIYEPVVSNLKSGNIVTAVQQIERAEMKGEYSEKDRVLLFLDKGMLYHYQGEYQKSNIEFDKAEDAIDDLYTKSVSKAAASFLLNDNALDYSGEVYENLYVNIFKALNYIHLNKFDEAYVEINRVNDKLKELDLYFEDYISDLNSSKDSKVKIDAEKIDYYSNVLSHYLSYLIFRSEREYDNSRISYEKLVETWDTYTDVYNYDKPYSLDTLNAKSGSYLNFIAFAGTAPIKKPVGARITTFDDYVVVSDPTNFRMDGIPFPGIKSGWNFKFEFPVIYEEGTAVHGIEIYIDSISYGNMQLLENMASVANKTFESRKSILYFKTLGRAVAKGVASSALGREIKKEANGFVGELLAFLTNVVVDATENADLRSWRTMPSYSFISEVPINPGKYNIEIHFLGPDNQILQKNIIENYTVGKGLNLIEAFHLN
ncbi:MAG: hypothetical protein KJ799_03820 [Bacteroidetes bacterium]|nr:hypothetical protein [Bacteroidota bacterium]